jgi:hypothetical protein
VLKMLSQNKEEKYWVFCIELEYFKR